mmetsp:Transcript_170/g.294  ORF Transcript_170/g.294 Transcript_170/m.294 type:complete len:116 (+) Transcript_170:1562-1909(+)
MIWCEWINLRPNTNPLSHVGLIPISSASSVLVLLLFSTISTKSVDIHSSALLSTAKIDSLPTYSSADKRQASIKDGNESITTFLRFLDVHEDDDAPTVSPDTLASITKIASSSIG